MSEKDQIREMVYALARGDHEAAQKASKAAFAAKTKRIAEAALEDESEEELEEGMHNPAHRRATAARRHMRRARDVEVAKEARRERGEDDEEDFLIRRRKRRPAPSMRRRRPRRSDMYESDTGADSATIKGAHDAPQDDNTERKGSVKDSGVVKGSHDDTKSKVEEKWNKDTETPKAERGKYKGKTKEELEKMLAAVKKSGPHKKGSEEFEKQNELEFALRAKNDWGKVE